MTYTDIFVGVYGEDVVSVSQSTKEPIRIQVMGVQRLPDCIRKFEIIL
jgi:hypothetical protein